MDWRDWVAEGKTWDYCRLGDPKIWQTDFAEFERKVIATKEEMNKFRLSVAQAANIFGDFRKALIGMGAT